MSGVLACGIPVTRPVLTLVDIATRLTRDELEAAVNAADKFDLVDPGTLRSALDDLTPRPGVGVLRETLDRRTFTLTDSQLERIFLPLARRAGLVTPLRFARSQVRFEPAHVEETLQSVVRRLIREASR